jgi:hypothetical protein
VPGRGVDPSAPRPTPLTLVAGALAGDDLQRVAATVARALQSPVAIAIPALGDPVVFPEGSLAADAAAVIAAHAAAIARGENITAPHPMAEAVPVRIGEQIVGIVEAVTDSAAGADAAVTVPERRAWLEAAAAASSVTTLIREADNGVTQGSAEVLLAELAAGLPEDLPGMLVRARRLGLDLSAGAVAISARQADVDGDFTQPAGPNVVVAQLRPGRLLALAALAGGDEADPAGELVRAMRTCGMTVAVSSPRRDPALLHEAVREAELLVELEGAREAPPAGQDETLRLLIGVLLRDRSELEQLRDRTITPLADYDARHDTELLATLRAFLAHDGSTTETADAMKLHRHTVGYRLSRVHEVSGLSPYESDGRERLSLGIKAHRILDAERRMRETEC